MKVSGFNVPPKHWWLATKLRSITVQKTIIRIWRYLPSVLRIAFPHCLLCNISSTNAVSRLRVDGSLTTHHNSGLKLWTRGVIHPFSSHVFLVFAVGISKQLYYCCRRWSFLRRLRLMKHSRTTTQSQVAEHTMSSAVTTSYRNEVVN